MSVAKAEEFARFLNLPPELTVFVIAMLPVFELRGAIPVAITVFDMSIPKAYILGVTGNTVPVPFLLILLGRTSSYLSRKHRIFERFFSWFFQRTRKKVEDKYREYGALALIPFVAIPLPITGAWTGCAAAWVFGIKFKYAFPAIVFGILVSGTIVTAVTAGAVNITP
ncbi:MAG: COG2426 family protein [Halobacteria archaeon]